MPSENPNNLEKPKTRKKPSFKAKTEAKKKAAKEQGIIVQPVKREIIVTPEKNKGGRPSPIEEVADKIIASIRNGNTYDCASGCARVSYASFRLWMKKGREAEELENFDNKYYKFYRDVEEAERACEEEVLGYWKKEMPGNWQAAKDFLARRHHKSWGPKDKIDVTSNGETVGKPFFMPMKDTEDDE